MRKYVGTFVIVFTVVFMAGCFITINNLATGLQMKELHVGEPSILFLKLEGVIIDANSFLEDLKEHAKEDYIKGVLIQVNSPGGVVGPSQELYAEIKRVSQELKKPVYVSCGALAASGAYYAALGADQIYTNPGTLVGSIGVIMEFANLEKLYDWAKIRRYAIKTGAYKDSGAEYREMREDEKMLFQSMANEVLAQFKQAIVESRKLTPEDVTKYADGRIFTGSTAVKLGLADKVGTLSDAIKDLGKKTGLGDDPELFDPNPEKPEIFKELMGANTQSALLNKIDQMMNLKLMGQPLFIYPGALY